MYICVCICAYVYAYAHISNINSRRCTDRHKVNLCVYVDIYVYLIWACILQYVYICLYICIYVYIHTCIKHQFQTLHWPPQSTYMCICRYICIWYMCMYIIIYIYVCLYVCIYVCIHTYTSNTPSRRCTDQHKVHKCVHVYTYVYDICIYI